MDETAQSPTENITVEPGKTLIPRGLTNQEQVFFTNLARENNIPGKPQLMIDIVGKSVADNPQTEQYGAQAVQALEQAQANLLSDPNRFLPGREQFPRIIYPSSKIRDPAGGNAVSYKARQESPLKVWGCTTQDPGEPVRYQVIISSHEMTTSEQFQRATELTLEEANKIIKAKSIGNARQ